MVISEDPAAADQGVLIEGASPLILAHRAQVGCKVVGRGEGFGMVIAQHATEAGVGVGLEAAGVLVLAQGFQGKAEQARPLAPSWNPAFVPVEFTWRS